MTNFSNVLHYNITTIHGDNMIQVGDLCKVIKNGHTYNQLGNHVLITRIIGTCYAEGINLTNDKTHHYRHVELEKL